MHVLLLAPWLAGAVLEIRKSGIGHSQSKEEIRKEEEERASAVGVVVGMFGVYYGRITDLIGTGMGDP